MRTTLYHWAELLDPNVDEVLQGLKDHDPAKIKRNIIKKAPHCDCGVGNKKLKGSSKMRPTVSTDGETCDFCEHYFVLLVPEGKVL